MTMAKVNIEEEMIVDVKIAEVRIYVNLASIYRFVAELNDHVNEFHEWYVKQANHYIDQINQINSTMTTLFNEIIEIMEKIRDSLKSYKIDTIDSHIRALAKTVAELTNELYSFKDITKNIIDFYALEAKGEYANKLKLFLKRHEEARKNIELRFKKNIEELHAKSEELSREEGNDKLIQLISSLSSELTRFKEMVLKEIENYKEILDETIHQLQLDVPEERNLSIPLDQLEDLREHVTQKDITGQVTGTIDTAALVQWYNNLVPKIQGAQEIYTHYSNICKKAINDIHQQQNDFNTLRNRIITSYNRFFKTKYQQFKTQIHNIYKQYGDETIDNQKDTQLDNAQLVQLYQLVESSFTKLIEKVEKIEKAIDDLSNEIEQRWKILNRHHVSVELAHLEMETIALEQQLCFYYDRPYNHSELLEILKAVQNCLFTQFMVNEVNTWKAIECNNIEKLNEISRIVIRLFQLYAKLELEYSFHQMKDKETKIRHIFTEVTTPRILENISDQYHQIETEVSILDENIEALKMAIHFKNDELNERISHFFSPDFKLQDYFVHKISRLVKKELFILIQQPTDGKQTDWVASLEGIPSKLQQVEESVHSNEFAGLRNELTEITQYFRKKIDTIKRMIFFDVFVKKINDTELTLLEHLKKLLQVLVKIDAFKQERIIFEKVLTAISYLEKVKTYQISVEEAKLRDEAVGIILTFILKYWSNVKQEIKFFLAKNIALYTQTISNQIKRYTHQAEVWLFTLQGRSMLSELKSRSFELKHSLNYDGIIAMIDANKTLQSEFDQLRSRFYQGLTRFLTNIQKQERAKYRSLYEELAHYQVILENKQEHKRDSIARTNTDSLKEQIHTILTIIDIILSSKLHLQEIFANSIVNEDEPSDKNLIYAIYELLNFLERLHQRSLAEQIARATENVLVIAHKLSIVNPYVFLPFIYKIRPKEKSSRDNLLTSIKDMLNQMRYTTWEVHFVCPKCWQPFNHVLEVKKDRKWFQVAKKVFPLIIEMLLQIPQMLPGEYKTEIAEIKMVMDKLSQSIEGENQETQSTSQQEPNVDLVEKITNSQQFRDIPNSVKLVSWALLQNLTDNEKRALTEIKEGIHQKMQENRDIVRIIHNYQLLLYPLPPDDTVKLVTEFYQIAREEVTFDYTLLAWVHKTCPRT